MAIQSKVLSEFDYDQLWYRASAEDLKLSPNSAGVRKNWELCFIVAALRERGMLRQSKKGLGFGVGNEPLPAKFRQWGCDIVATDMPLELDNGAWTKTGQHCSAALPLDMNRIPLHLFGQFDFVWSTSCFEHLGSIEKGLTFWHYMRALLKPGGVAVHVTEYNLTSKDETLDSGDVVIFREKDLRQMVPDIDLTVTNGDIERRLPTPDADGYYRMPHLRLPLGGFVLTSVGLIYERPL